MTMALNPSSGLSLRIQCLWHNQLGPGCDLQILHPARNHHCAKLDDRTYPDALRGSASSGASSADSWFPAQSPGGHYSLIEVVVTSRSEYFDLSRLTSQPPDRALEPTVPVCAMPIDHKNELLTKPYGLTR